MPLATGDIMGGGLSAGLNPGPCDRRWRGVQDHSSLIDPDSRLRIGCQGSLQCFLEARAEMPYGREAGTELCMHSGPTDRRRALERVQTPSQPDIEVKGEGAVAQLTDRSLAERYRMGPDRIEEDLVEDHTVFPESALISRSHGVELHAGVDDAARRPAVGRLILPKELQAAGGDARGLLPHRLGRLT